MTNPTPAQASVEAVLDALTTARTTAANDDYSKPGTIERQRHCQRLDAMQMAADEIARLAALSPPPTVGAEDEAVAWAEEYGGKIVSVALKEGSFHRTPLCRSTRPSPSAVEVGLRVALSELVEAVEFTFDMSGQPDLRKRLEVAKAMCERPPVSCIASEKGE